MHVLQGNIAEDQTYIPYVTKPTGILVAMLVDYKVRIHWRVVTSKMISIQGNLYL